MLSLFLAVLPGSKLGVSFSQNTRRRVIPCANKGVGYNHDLHSDRRLQFYVLPAIYHADTDGEMAKRKIITRLCNDNETGKLT